MKKIEALKLIRWLLLKEGKDYSLKAAEELLDEFKDWSNRYNGK